MRSWREAQSFCQESGESLATVRDEEENAFLSCKPAQRRSGTLARLARLPVFAFERVLQGEECGRKVVHGGSVPCLADAFLEDGWHMWIGLRFASGWKWSDSSPPGYFRWHPGKFASAPREQAQGLLWQESEPSCFPEEAPSEALGQCAVLSFQPADTARHGTWKTRPCSARPPSEATGFICRHRDGECRAGKKEAAAAGLPGR